MAAARRLPAQARPGTDARAVRRRADRATRRCSSSSVTTHGGSITTCGSSGTAPSRAGPSRRGSRSRPGERHLAVHVEDHPLDYASFEGVIPAGEYGAGTVEIWDRGTYELLEEKRNGGLTVHLHGERVDGVWTLVPARLDGDERNWLLLRKDAPRRRPCGAPPAARDGDGDPADRARAGSSSRNGTDTARS